MFAAGSCKTDCSGPLWAPSTNEMSLEELRKSLSTVDEEIVELIARRQQLVGQIGRSKQSKGAGTRDYAREKDVLDMGEFIAEFQRDESGSITGVLFSSGRVRNLQLDKMN